MKLESKLGVPLVLTAIHSKPSKLHMPSITKPPGPRNFEMAQEILQEISKALETHEPNPLVFTELDRDVASQVLALLKQPKYNFDKSGFRHVFRLHYSAPDRYLRLVLLTDIHESVAGWMRREVSIWFGDRRLDAATLDKIIGWTPSMLTLSKYRISSHITNGAGLGVHKNYEI